MRELLIKMSDISTQKFGSRITDLHGYGCDMAPLWQLMEARSSGASRAWIDWLNGEGEMPESTPKRNHVSTMEAPENLPELSDALETLDQELGFLD